MLPSGEMASAQTLQVWPMSVLISEPSTVDHTRIELSSDLKRRIKPKSREGDRAQHRIASTTQHAMAAVSWKGMARTHQRHSIYIAQTQHSHSTVTAPLSMR